MFVAMGLSAVFPIFHGLKLYGLSRMGEMVGLKWVVLQGALYIVGAATYAVCHPLIRPSDNILTKI